jgi:DNA polymerase III subunit alpha
VNFYGFLDQVPLAVCNKRVIESLIKAGAFESMGHTRRALMSVYESAVDAVLDLKRNEANGQDDLFGGGTFDEGEDTDPVLMGSVPDLPDWDKRTKLAFEREMLGLYVSDHPLQGLEHVLAAERDAGIGELLAEEEPREGMVTIAGMITGITRKTTKRGDIWAVITVEDLEASIEVLLFPKAYEAVSTVLATDTVVKVKGRLKRDDEAVSLNASELTLPDVNSGPSGPVIISLSHARCTPAVLDQLRAVLAQHPGSTEVQVRLIKPDRTLIARLPNHRVRASQPLMADLKALLGPSCLAS